MAARAVQAGAASLTALLPAELAAQLPAELRRRAGLSAHAACLPSAAPRHLRSAMLSAAPEHTTVQRPGLLLKACCSTLSGASKVSPGPSRRITLCVSEACAACHQSMKYAEMLLVCRGERPASSGVWTASGSAPLTTGPEDDAEALASYPEAVEPAALATCQAGTWARPRAQSLKKLTSTRGLCIAPRCCRLAVALCIKRAGALMLVDGWL